MNALGKPAGMASPTASRRRAASSTAATRAPTRMARRSCKSVSIHAAGSAALRAAISSSASGPRSASRSWRSSAWRAWRSGVSRWSSSSSCGDHRRIEQLAELLGAEQIAQQVAVERERRDPALGERRVALVHVHRDPAEQQALRER